MLKSLSMLLAIFAVGIEGATAIADASPALKVGDPAPPLNPQVWIKGAPITHFARGRVYVVEFWATWCPTCREMIGRLTSLQRKYAGRLTVIAVDVRESREGSNGSGGALQKVREFVAHQGDAMAYAVAFDDPVQAPVYSQWVLAAGAQGFPCALIVDRKGRVAWVGYTVHNEAGFNAALRSVVAGNNDLSEGRVQQAAIRKETEEGAEFNKVFEPINLAWHAEDYPAMLAEVDRQSENYPQYAPRLFAQHLIALSHTNEKGAWSYADERSKDREFLRARGLTNDQYWRRVAVLIAEQKGLNADSYQRAGVILADLVSKNPRDFSNWRDMAVVRFSMGDAKGAVDAQERAIDLAEKQEHDGTTDAVLVKTLQEKLTEYRDAVASPPG